MAELLAVHGIARVSGVRGQEPLVWLAGLREIDVVSMAPQPKATAIAMCTRIAGDGIDPAMATVPALDVACARTLEFEAHAATHITDYSDRSGFPSTPAICAASRVPTRHRRIVRTAPTRWPNARPAPQRPRHRIASARSKDMRTSGLPGRNHHPADSYLEGERT